MIIRAIPEYEGLYSITIDGKVYSHISRRYKKTYKGNYEYVRLSKNGKEKHFSIHRLVAITYIPNPNHYPIVDHIDNNPFDNNVDNLQWLTQRDNVHRSYEKLSPIRNFTECKLYKGDKLIGYFKSKRECCRYCADKLGLSYTGMIKYNKKKDYIIKV